MSERRALLLAFLLALTMLVVLVPEPAHAQTLEEWRSRMATAGVKNAELAARFNGRFDRKLTFDRALIAGGLTFSFAGVDLNAQDTASISSGVTAGIAAIRERYGDAAVSLLDGTRWLVERDVNRRFRGRDQLRVSLPGNPHISYYVGSPARPAEIERFLLSYAGHRLVETTPSLRIYDGWAAFRPDDASGDELLAEVARRLAISSAGTARRCASGAIDSCALMLSPFDAKGEPRRYFDPGDFRRVVATAGIPPFADSAYFRDRKRCLEGEEPVCARIVARVDLPDPFNPMVRGTVLMHAIELGGRDAVARAKQKADAAPLEAVAFMAGVSEDSLVRSWHRRVHRALEQERAAPTVPLLFASAGWGAVFLLIARRRRYL